jgi:hypothetical protein
MRHALGCAIALFIGLFSFVALFWIAWQLIVVAAVALTIAVAWRVLRGR